MNYITERPLNWDICKNPQHWFDLITLGYCNLCDFRLQAESHDCNREARDEQDACRVCDERDEDQPMPF